MGRSAFLVWALLVCPFIGAVVATAGVHGEGGLLRFVFIFFVLPPLLSIPGAIATRRGSVEATLGLIGAAVMGGVAWVAVIALAAASGVYDT